MRIPSFHIPISIIYSSPYRTNKQVTTRKQVKYIGRHTGRPNRPDDPPNGCRCQMMVLLIPPNLFIASGMRLPRHDVASANLAPRTTPLAGARIGC